MFVLAMFTGLVFQGQNLQPKHQDSTSQIVSNSRISEDELWKAVVYIPQCMNSLGSDGPLEILKGSDGCGYSSAAV